MKILHNFYIIITNPKFYIVAIIIIFIIVLLNLVDSRIKSKLKTRIYTSKCFYLDWWSISHFILYIYFGYVFPEYFVEFLLIGGAWELFESTACKIPNLVTSKCDDNSSLYCKILANINSCDYWYGKMDDVAVNMTGYLIGSVISRYHS
jgi:hypothetical protein